MMRLPIFLLLFLTGCCRVAELTNWPPVADTGPETAAALYRFRLERTGETRFSGLLALKHETEGILTILLDASGMPLLRQTVQADGTRQVAFCATPLRETRLPELLGKVVEYIYFTPGETDCPWYAFACVCLEDSPDRQGKWQRFGPLHLWEVEQDMPTAQLKRFTIRLNLSAVTVSLQELPEGQEK